jgi:SAM-dependent methyltransferase
MEGRASDPTRIRANLRRTAKLAHNAACRVLLTPLLRHEWRHGIATVTERLVWYKVALGWIIERYPQTLLDVGPGPSAWPHLLAFGGIRVTAIDTMESAWHRPFLNRLWFFNRHWYVIRDDITSSRVTERFDFVTCLSVLELIEDHRAAVRGMFDRLKPGGFLVLSFPYNEHHFIDNAYALPGAGYGRDLPYICRQYSRAEVDEWLTENSAVVVGRELYRCFTGEFWTMGERLSPPTRAEANDPHHLACFLLQKA